MFLKSKSDRKIKLPSVEEDQIIAAAANTDPDSKPLTDEEWDSVKPFIRRGRPPLEITKEKTSSRISRDVIDQFKASGDDWQSRIDNALKDWLKSHSAV